MGGSKLLRRDTLTYLIGASQKNYNFNHYQDSAFFGIIL